jgi:two-component system cell cycle response regulator
MQATILVIEDDPPSLELMTYLLNAHGYVTLSAERGDDGLAIARRERPDLVVCDIQLPGFDGYEIARLLKADVALRTMPLVAVTALAMVGDREKALAAGFDDYVSKPIDPATFVALIEPLLDPHQRSATSVAPPARPVAKPAMKVRATILVVDDIAVNLELKRSILEPSGYRVLTAGNVARGLQLARDQKPDLIISDVGMPDAGGMELLQMAKADPLLRDIPIVIMTTTHLEGSMRQTALSLGAARFLLRPMEAQDILREVEACLVPAQGGEHGSHPDS